METEILIIGSGIAGMNTALKASKFAKVTLATKANILESNTFYAQGGLAGAFGKDDSPMIHMQDTLRAGDGISDEKNAKTLAKEAPIRIKELERLGVKFNKNKNNFKLSREAVHTRARIVHCSDITGKKIIETLSKHIRKNKKIQILEHHIAYSLIKDEPSYASCS
jgi:L-aspartate oxidase